MSSEKPKTGIILGVMFGLFGIFCLCMAITATDKYRTQKARVKQLEAKLSAGKQEFIKVPTLQLTAMDATSKQTMAESDLSDMTEEKDELSSELEELQGEVETLQFSEAYSAAEIDKMSATISELREKLAIALQSADVDKINSLEEGNRKLRSEVESLRTSNAAAEKSIAKLKAAVAEKGKVEPATHPAPTLIQGGSKRVKHLLARTERENAKLAKKVAFLESKNEKAKAEIASLKEALAAAQEAPAVEAGEEAADVVSALRTAIESTSAELLPELRQALKDLWSKAISPYTAERDLRIAYKETETRLAGIESALALNALTPEND